MRARGFTEVRLNAQAHVVPFYRRCGFVPHGVCLLWRPDILALHVASDMLIGLSYFSIPVALVYSFFVEYYVAGLTGSVKG